MTTAPYHPLQELSRILAAQPGDEAAARIGAAVQRVLDGDEDSLDAALSEGRGWRSWRSDLARAERDRLICEIEAEFFADRPTREAAREIAKGLDRFHSGVDWRRFRNAETNPFPQGLKAKFWLILKAIDRPLSAARIRDLLAGGGGLSTSQQISDDFSNDT
ncbi:hypothetical protein [Rhizobium sp. L43]|uniref:hypothetical protein n=1 Tax=Rhizobium sp. L43 TaxID=2035452 RepID=UPI000BE7C848|nr:hypothetical protein [Rhizobium sp. L43]PDS79157.1 hypothetical protein CO667_10090 [Rhizobium sp. L43]